MPRFSRLTAGFWPLSICCALLLVAGTTLLGCGSDDSPTDPGDGNNTKGPTASFTATPTSGVVGSGKTLQVQFTDASTPGSSPITAWSWEFGDGSTSSAQNPLHTYVTVGAFDVSLTVSTADGADTATRTGYVVTSAPADQSTLIPGLITIALPIGATDIFDVRATGPDGSPAAISVVSNNTGFATANLIGSNRVQVTAVQTGKTSLTVSAGALTKNIAVEVYNPMYMETDGMLLTFVDEFDWRWNDGGSGGNRNGGYWHPVTTQGFFALGSIGLPNYSDPNQKRAALVVKPVNASSTALARPIDYVRIWADSGSGASNDGSFWQPVPPPGYVAMGLVAQRGYGKPDLDQVRCVRKDLTVPGRAGALVWNDSGTGADSDFGSWEIDIPVGATPESVAHMAVGCFVGTNSWSAPASNDVMNVLKVRFQTLSEGDPQFYVPYLSGLAKPDALTEQMLGKSMLVPFTAIDDATYANDVHWQVTNSPFYRLDRSAFYTLLFHNYNQTSLVQENSDTYTSGVTQTESDTYHVTTGVKVTAEGGVSFLGTGGKVSVEVSVEMGYATTSERAVLQERSVTKTIATQPGKAAALWQQSSSFTLYRHFGTALQFVGAPWVVGEDSYVTDEYPD